MSSGKPPFGLSMDPPDGLSLHDDGQNRGAPDSDHISLNDVFSDAGPGAPAPNAGQSEQAVQAEAGQTGAVQQEAGNAAGRNAAMGAEYLSLGRAVSGAGGSASGAGQTDPIPGKWGGAKTANGFSGGGGAASSASVPGPSSSPRAGGSSGPAGLPPTPDGGAWQWVPYGMEPKRPWRKRHPILFWGGFLLLLGLVFSFGRYGKDETPLSGPKIAVIALDGMILDAKRLVEFIDQVRGDSSIAGAVVRINSPGGGVGASQEIYAALKRLDTAKPLVASMGSVAASGGYYAALGAREIFSGPSSVTASIGVKMQIPNFQGLMKTVGVSEKTLTTGRLKDAGSSWREMTAAEESYFKALISDMYDEFVNTVAKERGVPVQQVRAIADGRAMTGRQALDAGLVDTLGDFYDALARVKSLCGINANDRVRLIKGPEEKATYLNELLGSVVRTAIQESQMAQQPIFMY
ncbi:signal peptide peptidase SppA [Desulfovibrio sp. OttesenSCG-928-G15]|nr:signal peptide peptidase SppA [Desulfovibrio sp. OttesenSCG-928-G15]